MTKILGTKRCKCTKNGLEKCVVAILKMITYVKSLGCSKRMVDSCSPEKVYTVDEEK